MVVAAWLAWYLPDRASAGQGAQQRGETFYDASAYARSGADSCTTRYSLSSELSRLAPLSSSTFANRGGSFGCW